MDILCIVPTLLFSGVSSVGNLHLSYILSVISSVLYHKNEISLSNTPQSLSNSDRVAPSYIKVLRHRSSKVLGEEMNTKTPSKVKIR